MEGTVELVFWDVQHGHSTYIKTPNGKHLFIDLGMGSKSDEKFSPILHLKNKYKVDSLDLVTITHPHKDHMDDLLNIDEVNLKVFTRPFHLNESDILTDRILDIDRPLFEKYIRLTNKYLSPLRSGHSNNYREADNLGGLHISEFIPQKCATSNLNNHSVVTILSYADTKIVIPGDNEEPSLKELLEQPAFVNAVKDSDILLAPHHGRKAGYCEEFVRIVNPRVTVISDSSLKETSARHKYTMKGRGWNINYKSGNTGRRKTVSTYFDGVIIVKLGLDTDGTPYLNIRTKNY
jgi:competence protein ComEC